MIEKEIFEWIMENDEFSRDKFNHKFKIKEEDLNQIIKILEIEGVILESPEGIYITLERAKIIKKILFGSIVPKIKDILKNVENVQSVSEGDTYDWSDLREINKFVIFDGHEKIYEIYYKDKKIRLEGREIMDYKIFILRFYENFGIMLHTYKGIGIDWANLVSYWTRKYGQVSKEKIEVISDVQEAKEILIDYVNNCTISDTHLVKEGIVCVKDDCIFVPTRIIKKILKRNDLRVSLRKLGYEIDEYLLSASVPLKIENKSERFWKFDKRKFEMDESMILKIVEEEND